MTTLQVKVGLLLGLYNVSSMGVLIKVLQHAKIPCLNQVGPLGMPCLERHLLTGNGTYSKAWRTFAEAFDSLWMLG